MKINKYTVTIAALVLVILALLLNPSAERHREAMRSQASERGLLEGALAQFTAAVADYQSLGLASYTKVNGKVTSIGVLGLVFVTE